MAITAKASTTSTLPQQFMDRSVRQQLALALPTAREAGSIMTNEILYLAKIHPLSQGSLLAPSDLNALLHHAIQFSTHWLHKKLHGKGLHPLIYQKEQCPLGHMDSLSNGLRTCYRYLEQTGWSFGAAMQAMDSELRHAACIYFLVLRALDTIEDDMSISLETKIPMLREFHTYLHQPGWRYTESKAKDKQVLEDFPTISLEFRNLAKVYQDVITDTCHKMGVGMAEFLEKRVDSLQDLEKYCRCVAGLGGIGFSRLYSASELEDPIVGQDTELASSMTLFMQKTNIIHDYLEDQLEGREFWPREVWSRYAEKLSDLAKPENATMAVRCLNEMITDALQHVPDVLKYLSRLKNKGVFNYWASLQVIAIATLAACYNNKDMFRGIVKMQKEQAVTLMRDATNMQAVKAIMSQHLEEIYQKIPSTDPSSNKTKEIIASLRPMILS